MYPKINPKKSLDIPKLTEEGKKKTLISDVHATGPPKVVPKLSVYDTKGVLSGVSSKRTATRMGAEKRVISNILADMNVK